MRDTGTYERYLTGYDFEKYAGACWDDSTEEAQFEAH